MSVHYDGLLGISARIRSRDVTSREVTEALLDRIARYDVYLHSALLVLGDAARDAADAADSEIAAGRWRGPLHGVPIGIKDLLWTRGLPTTGGMELHRDFRPGEDATVVERLKQAGAVVVAKLHMTEGATLDHHPFFPRPVNPWSAAHWTGVSSSGSGVAPAAGLCFGAIGSDTGGSIRMPSAANNLTGIKPTWGRISRHGVIHLAESLDHLGPMARSTGDAAAILQAIAGADPRDPTSLVDPVPDYLSTMNDGIAGMTIGIDWDYIGVVDDRIAMALRHALQIFEKAGAQIRDVHFPWRDEDAAATLPITSAELRLAHAETFPAQADRYGHWLRATLAQPPIDGLAVARGHIARDRYQGRLRAFFAETDFVALPALGCILPRWEEVGDPMVLKDLMRFTTPFNVAGSPTISLPAGFTAEGLPIGIQLGARWLAEPELIRAGVAFQKATDFHMRRPDLEALMAVQPT
jgi:amidase